VDSKDHISRLARSLLAGGGIVTVALLAYWLFVVGEGTYLGRRFVRLLYRVGAAHYDRVRGFPSAADARVLGPLLWAALPARRPAVVLDVATGTGRAGLLLAAEAPFAGSVLGLDYTPAMLCRAVQRSRTIGCADRFCAVVAEAGQLPLPAASCDMVICLEALEYFPAPRRALREMGQALRPGGVLVLSKFTDGWARLLPAKAFSRRSLRWILTELELAPVVILPWQAGNYELVLALKNACL
jgi:ubiquinone/menaquinone biosynthesis C-methylase UbiE